MAAKFEHSREVSAGAWIAPRLRGEFGAVGLVCPTGFEAYARVFSREPGLGLVRLWA